MPWFRLWSSSSSQDDIRTQSDKREDYVALAKDALGTAKTTVSETVEDIEKAAAGTSNSNKSVLATFAQPETIVGTVILTTLALFSIRGYQLYLRRIPTATDIKPSFFRKRSLFGQVTRVGDGDNFRIFHTPGGRLGGWGWFPGRKVPSDKSMLKDNTVRSLENDCRQSSTAYVLTSCTVYRSMSVSLELTLPSSHILAILLSLGQVKRYPG